MHEVPFQLGQRLAEGAYASIYICRPHKTTSAELYAIKIIDKSGIIQSGRQTQKQIDGEVKLHKLCGTSHQAHIIDFLASAETSLGTVWICMEFADGGDLFDKIEPDVGVDEDIALLFFKQLLSGLRFIHSRGVSHRDIKPENILLDGNGKLKIADFGLAALYQYQGKRRMLGTACGSPPYAAPEILSTYDGEMVDVWSLGVVLFAMSLGSTPWNEPTAQCNLFRKFARSRGRPDYAPWDALSPAVYDLLLRMLSIDPSQRLTLEQVENHAWVQQEMDEPDPISLANTLMSKIQVDLTQPPKSQSSNHTSSQQQMDQLNDLPPTTQNQGTQHTSQRPLESVEDDPALSQFTGSTQILETLTQRAKRFADITGSDRLTRFYSTWARYEVVQKVADALTALDITWSEEVDGNAMTIKTLDTTGCQLLGYLTFHVLRNGMTVVEFNKRKGDPQQWRRLFKVIVFQVREIIYTG